MELEKNNKLMAKFMGCIESQGMLKFPFSFPIKVIRCKGGLHLPYDWLRFDSDWDWLIPAVEKIESIENIHVRIEYTSCTIFNFKEVIICTNEDTKFKAVYKAVVECIEWLKINKNTK